MQAAAIAPIRRPGLITRALLFVSGADEETLRECPQHDRENLRAIALLMLVVWLYQAGLIAIVAHRLLAPDGELHPGLVLVAFFIATLILMIDSYVFLRAGFHADGIRELARAGLDLSGGFMAKLASHIFLAFRILLSLTFAQLTAIFMGLILYQSDIRADLSQRSQEENTAVIDAAENHVDAEIQQDQQAVKDAQQRVDALQSQLDVTLRYLRGPLPWRNKERAEQAQAMLPDLQRNLQTATAALATQQANLSVLVDGRETAVQKAIDNSPDHIETAAGILAQLKALRRIAADPEIAAVILLIDLTSFGLELAAVLAKVTTFIPTTYAALLARNSFVRVATIADELEEIINRRGRTEREDAPPRREPRFNDRPNNVTWFPTAHGQGATPAAGKRPRGRPRKDGLNGGSPAVPGENKHNPDKDGEGH